MQRRGCVLHASDFSPASRAAFRKAVELAKATRRDLVLMHVLAPVVVPDVYLSPATYDELQRSGRQTAQRQLNKLVSKAKDADVPVSTRLVEGVPVHERIVRTAKAVHADLIVMGTHGRSGVSRFFLGSVAARVVAGAPCPVLTVRGH